VGYFGVPILAFLARQVSLSRDHFIP